MSTLQMYQGLAGLSNRSGICIPRSQVEKQCPELPTKVTLVEKVKAAAAILKYIILFIPYAFVTILTVGKLNPVLTEARKIHSSLRIANERVMSIVKKVFNEITFDQTTYQQAVKDLNESKAALIGFRGLGQGPHNAEAEAYLNHFTRFVTENRHVLFETQAPELNATLMPRCTSPFSSEGSEDNEETLSQSSMNNEEIS